MRFSATLIMLLVAATNILAASETKPSLIIRDPKSGVIYYVESDHRHVVAISSEGQVLWCVVPWKVVLIHIDGITLTPGGGLNVDASGSGSQMAILDPKTGALEIVQGL